MMTWGRLERLDLVFLFSFFPSFFTLIDHAQPCWSSVVEGHPLHRHHRLLLFLTFPPQGYLLSPPLSLLSASRFFFFFFFGDLGPRSANWRALSLPLPLSLSLLSLPPPLCDPLALVRSPPFFLFFFFLSWFFFSILS